MRLFFLSLTLAFSQSLQADSESTPIAQVMTSESGTAFFKMVPGDFWLPKDRQTGVQPHGIAYQVNQEGRVSELWRVEGWYAWKVYLSDDGRFMVRMGPWSCGGYARKEDLAVAFYDNGKLLREYSTLELLKDPSRVVRSVSHYEWMVDGGRSWRNPDLEPDLHEYDKTFSLATCDGWKYTFSLETGAITKSQRINVEPGDWATEEQVDQLVVSLLVAKYPVPLQDFPKWIGLGRHRLYGGWSAGALSVHRYAITNPNATHGYLALEVTIKDYRFHGGPDGAGTGTVTAARLLSISDSGYIFVHEPSDELRLYCGRLPDSTSNRPQSPSELAGELIRGFNGRRIFER